MRALTVDEVASGLGCAVPATLATLDGDGFPQGVIYDPLRGGDRTMAGDRALDGFVLVHGGAHGAWCWQPTVERLRRPALAVDLPGRDGSTTSFEQMAASVIHDIEGAGWSRVVLVGHSMGGVTITEVARQRPDLVDQLVLVSCAVPPEGGAIVDTLPLPARWLVRRRAAAAGDDGGGGGSMPAALARWMFCNDLDEAQTAFVLEHLGPEDPSLVVAPVTREGLDPELPRTYVRLRRDRSISPRRQARMIANLGGADERWLDAGHDVMIGQPTALAALLEDLAGRPRAVEGR